MDCWLLDWGQRVDIGITRNGAVAGSTGVDGTVSMWTVGDGPSSNWTVGDGSVGYWTRHGPTLDCWLVETYDDWTVGCEM